MKHNEDGNGTDYKRNNAAYMSAAADEFNTNRNGKKKVDDAEKESADNLAKIISGISESNINRRVAQALQTAIESITNTEKAK